MLDNILTILLKPFEFVSDYIQERKLGKTDAKISLLWDQFFTEGADQKGIQAKIAKKIEKIETKVAELQSKSPGKIKAFHEYFIQRAVINRATFAEIIFPQEEVRNASYSPEQQLQECEAEVNKQWQTFYKTLSTKDLQKVNKSVHAFRHLAAAFGPANEYFRQAADAHLLALNDLFPSQAKANPGVPLEQKQKRSKLQFIQNLRKHFEVRDVIGDGNCLLRAIVNSKSPGIANDAQSEEKRIKNLRAILVKYISNNESYFRPFVTEQDVDMADLGNGEDPFKNYLREIGRNGTWLGNVELHALSEILHRPIWVYRHEGVIEKEGLTPMPQSNFCFGMEKYSNEEPLKVLYVNDNHYIALLPKAN